MAGNVGRRDHEERCARRTAAGVVEAEPWLCPWISAELAGEVRMRGRLVECGCHGGLLWCKVGSTFRICNKVRK